MIRQKNVASQEIYNNGNNWYWFIVDMAIENTNLNIKYIMYMNISGWNDQVLYNDEFPCGNTDKNKANLRDLTATTGLVILLKLDSNHRFFSQSDLEMDDIEKQ